MDASEWVAWYAAGVSTVVGGWQIWSSYREKAIRLVVKPEVGIASLSHGTGEALSIHVRNDSAVPVTVEEVGMVVGGPGFYKKFTPDPEAALPGRIPPRETHSFHIPRTRMAFVPGEAGGGMTMAVPLFQEPLNMTHGKLVFYALTSDGRRFRSKPVELERERFLQVSRLPFRR
jgi:hypothetical protein